MKNNALFFLSLLAAMLVGTAAFALETAHPLGFPTAIGPVAESITRTYNFIYWICLGIFAVVQLSILYIIWRFRRSKNPTPATFSHNNLLEVAWTAVPVLICVAIAWMSFEAMFFIRKMPEEGETVEVIAYQFGWEFDYPDYEIGAPDPMEPHAELSSAGIDRYVKDMVVPVDTNIKLHITARDVIHAFYAPDLGMKTDAIPGRINYAWFKATKEGDYIGQCAELCGSAHGEMFFRVRVVSKPEYQAWVNAQRSAEGLAPVAAEGADVQQPVDAVPSEEGVVAPNMI